MKPTLKQQVNALLNDAHVLEASTTTLFQDSEFFEEEYSRDLKLTMIVADQIDKVVYANLLKDENEFNHAKFDDSDKSISLADKLATHLVQALKKLENELK